VIETLTDLLSQINRKILFVGIGNVLKQDDGIGVYISRKIKKTPVISVITAEVSIENYIGKINQLNPDILVLIDCVDIKKRPGSYALLNVSQIQDQTFNTHNISLKRLSEFFHMPVFILGVQPEKIEFGENISYLVKNVADKIINQINTKELHYGR
jgi:hydrogenase 3 maturation protease